MTAGTEDALVPAITQHHSATREGPGKPITIHQARHHLPARHGVALRCSTWLGDEIVEDAESVGAGGWHRCRRRRTILSSNPATSGNL